MPPLTPKQTEALKKLTIHGRMIQAHLICIALFVNRDEALAIMQGLVEKGPAVPMHLIYHPGCCEPPIGLLTAGEPIPDPYQCFECEQLVPRSELRVEDVIQMPWD